MVVLVFALAAGGQRGRRRVPGLLPTAGLFGVLAAVSGAAFAGLQRERPWRWFAQAAMWLLLAAIAWYYWPAGERAGDDMKGLDKEFRLLFLPATARDHARRLQRRRQDAEKRREAITGEVYRAHVAGLASDELQGREPGSEGERRTLEYIEKEYLELGFQPLAGGDFRQEVALVEITGSEQSLAFTGAPAA